MIHTRCQCVSDKNIFHLADFHKQDYFFLSSHFGLKAVITNTIFKMDLKKSWRSWMRPEQDYKVRAFKVQKSLYKR